MSEEPKIIENASGQLVERSEKQLTSYTDNMGNVRQTSFTGEIKTGQTKQKLQLISYIEKRPWLGHHRADPDVIASDRYQVGDKYVDDSLERGQKKEKLFQVETENILHLNRKGNPYVPKIIESELNYYKMQFVDGIPGNKVLGLRPNFETRMTLVDDTLEAVNSVFNDGVINLEYAPKNTIIIPNLKTGLPEGVKLIDFGISFRVDSEGNIEADTDLLNSIVRTDADGDAAGLLPPELNGNYGTRKVNAEKCLVWSLSHRIIRTWLNPKEISPEIDDFLKKAESDNPDDRPTLSEFREFVKKIEFDSSKVGSCVPEETLKTTRAMLGRPDTEIFIGKKETEKIAADIQALKEQRIEETIKRDKEKAETKEKEKALVKQLQDMANEFINSEPQEYGVFDVVEQIREDLDKEIKNLYEKLHDEIDFTNIQTITDSIAKLAAPTNQTSPDLSNAGMFPKQYLNNPSLGMDSPLASSMLKLALDEFGLKASTIIIKDRQIVLSYDENSDEFTLCDPLTKSVGENGISHGYVLKGIKREQLVMIESLYDEKQRISGGLFRIELKEKPENTNMLSDFDEERGVYSENILSTNFATLVELSVVLHNLENLPDKSKYPSLNNFEVQKIIDDANIFDHKKHLEEQS